MKKYTITPLQAIVEYKKSGLGDVSTQTIFRWLRSKMIVGSKVGGRWYIDKKKFIQFLKENKP